MEILMFLERHWRNGSTFRFAEESVADQEIDIPSAFYGSFKYEPNDLPGRKMLIVVVEHDLVCSIEEIIDVPENITNPCIRAYSDINDKLPFSEDEQRYLEKLPVTWPHLQNKKEQYEYALLCAAFYMENGIIKDSQLITPCDG